MPHATVDFPKCFLKNGIHLLPIQPSLETMSFVVTLLRNVRRAVSRDICFENTRQEDVVSPILEIVSCFECCKCLLHKCLAHFQGYFMKCKFHYYILDSLDLGRSVCVECEDKKSNLLLFSFSLYFFLFSYGNVIFFSFLGEFL